MVWRGIALWKAGSQKRLTRFICLFIFNTVGLLPIIYLAFFNKKKKK
jgi:methionyl-tRNA synthetase